MKRLKSKILISILIALTIFSPNYYGARASFLSDLAEFLNFKSSQEDKMVGETSNYRKPANFLELTDTPSSYVGSAGQAVVVNASSTGLNFQNIDLSGYLTLDQTTPQTLTASPIFNNLTAGRIPFASATKTLTDDSGLVWDNVNKRLGIGTATPAYKLDVMGTATTDAIRTAVGLDFNLVLAPTSFGATLTAGGSNLGIGTYRYLVIYVTALGVSEYYLSPDIITTDAGNRQVTLTVPVSPDPRVTSRRIYRTTVNGNWWEAKILTTIANNTATTYVDNIADGSLGATLVYGQPNTTNRFLTINGERAFMSNGSNTTLGLGAGRYLGDSGINNTFIGSYAGGGNSVIGSANTGVGNSALYTLSSGHGNTAVGWYALQKVSTNSNNTAVGRYALNATTGSSNTAFGFGAGWGSTANNYGLFLGYYAGRYETGDNTFIVDSLDRGNEATSRTSALLYGTTNTTPANQILVLGGGGKVGIGITPTARLHLPAGSATANTAPLKFTSGALLTTPESGAIESANNTIYFTDFTGTRKEIKLADKYYGEMYTSTNTTAIDILEAGTYYGIYEGLIEGESENFTFTEGTSIGVEITDDSGEAFFTSPTSHNLEDGDWVSIVGTNDNNVVGQVIRRGDETFQLVGVSFVSEESGFVRRGARLRAEVAGKYKVSFDGNVYNNDVDKVFIMSLIRNNTNQENIFDIKKLTHTGYQSMEGSGFISLEAGDDIWVGILNQTDSSNITLYNLNVNLIRI